jgi:hypothetical protein
MLVYKHESLETIIKLSVKFDVLKNQIFLEYLLGLIICEFFSTSGQSFKWK